MTITDLCRELRNWFEVSRHYGKFTVSGGCIDLSKLEENGSLQKGQYFRIMGSVFNDGVWQYPCSELDDETFSGTICPMAVPRDFIALLEDINAWMEAHVTELEKPYQSESFGGYSYSLKGGLADAAGGGSEPWKVMFSSRLSKWRKL